LYLPSATEIELYIFLFVYIFRELESKLSVCGQVASIDPVTPVQATKDISPEEVTKQLKVMVMPDT
jgi:hypothetical protein